MHSESKKIADFMIKEGYSDVKILEDGTVIATRHLMFTKAIFMGMNMFGYEKRYCYDDEALCDSQFQALRTNDDVPTGWIANRNG